MIFVIKGVGLLLVVVGVIFAVLPSLMQAFLAFAAQGRRVYIGGVVRVILGGLLVWASSAAALPWVPLALGMLMIAGGILIFALGLARVHAMIRWWQARSDMARRAVAIVAAFLGAALIFTA